MVTLVAICGAIIVVCLTTIVIVGTITVIKNIIENWYL
jgi:hypothetical protein